MIPCPSNSIVTKQLICENRVIQRQWRSYTTAVSRVTRCSGASFASFGYLNLKWVSMSVLSNAKRSVTNFPTYGRNFLPSHLFRSQYSSNSFSRSCIMSQTPRKGKILVSAAFQMLKARNIFITKQEAFSKIKYRTRSIYPYGILFIGLISAFCASCLASDVVQAERKCLQESGECDPSNTNFSHGKNVYFDYTIIGIPGDGSCLFRSLAHGACVRSGNPAPNESIQKKLADELRDRVADEFVKRREETEWFIDGDFDTYISQIRQPGSWGGEPEILMASHVLRMPITVYMYDKNAGGMISIAEYGQEYSKDNPIAMLYHGFGHYDALQISENQKLKSRL